MAETGKTRSLSIEEWSALAESGIKIPVTIQLEGKSMEPLIRFRKDYVTVIPLNRDIRVSDIVVFRNSDGRFCAHRVKKVQKDTIQTLGDNCFEPDKPADKDNVFGLIVSMERDGRKYNLDSPVFHFYGRIRMLLLPGRILKRSIIGFLWKFYVKIFKKNG